MTVVLTTHYKRNKPTADGYIGGKNKGRYKKMKLQTKLKKDGKQPQDKIKWAYYGYGILNCTGENTVKELPYEVKNAGFTEMNGETYCVDGAL